jgi:hypothetical protein
MLLVLVSEAEDHLPEPQVRNGTFQIPQFHLRKGYEAPGFKSGVFLDNPASLPIR